MICYPVDHGKVGVSINSAVDKILLQVEEETVGDLGSQARCSMSLAQAQELIATLQDAVAKIHSVAHLPLHDRIGTILYREKKPCTPPSNP